MAHIWQSVTCRVCFWVTHCSYSPLSIFAGGNSNRKLPHPHKYTAWYFSQSASPCTRNTQLLESQKTAEQALHGLYIEAACSELQGFPTSFSLLWENMEGLSLLFTQLDPWKGLLNLKFDMSSEVTGRHEGSNPSGRKGGGGEGE